LNISTFSGIPLNFYFENFSITKGHLFWYQAIERGDFTFEINFTKSNFNTYTHSLIFNVTKGDSEVIPSTTSITTYYSNDAEFSLTWQSIPNPNISSSPILRIINTSNIVIQPTSPEWLNNVIIHRMDNGNYSFTVISNRVGTVVITIHLYSDQYNLVSIDLQINITLMPTFEPQISYQSELIVGESLIISWDQWLSTNNENIPIDELQVLNDGLSIEYAPVDITELSFDITIDTEDFSQGFHNLTLIASSYGYENHNLSVFIEIIGREIEISIEIFPEDLIQGLDFIIKAILTYVSLQTDSVGFGSSMSLVPLEGVSVSFLVKIKYENGTTVPLEYDTTTNALGEAEFTVTGIYTLSAEGIESIKVTSEATASGKESTQSTPPNFFDIHKFEKDISEIPEELIVFIILLFSIIVISPIGFYTIRKRRKGRKTVRDSITKVPLEIIPKDTPEVAPEVTPPIAERKEDKGQLQVEDKTETEDNEMSAKKTEEKIYDIEEQQIKPSSWITQFPEAVSGCEKEIRFLFILVLKRKGRWYGKTSYNFLLKKKTDDVSATNLRKIYMILPQQTSYFTKEKTSIVITEEGKKIALIILKNKNR
ncbi:MAG: hypothetical protein ACW99Q_19105, partial [Candidatus Kariarchaeaceae archaeon]